MDLSQKIIASKVVIKNYKYLDAELKKPNYIVIAVSSKGIDWVCEIIKNYQGIFYITNKGTS